MLNDQQQTEKLDKIQAICFDFDGVILESVEIKTRAFIQLFQDQQEEHLDEIRRFHQQNKGISRFERFTYIYNNILGKALSKTESARLSNDFSNLIYDQILECPFVSGAKEILQQYFSQMPLFIISGTPHDEINKIAKARKIAQYFQAIYGSPTSKTEWIKFILKKHNFIPHQVLFIGDRLNDYKAAKENNLQFIGRIGETHNIIELEHIEFKIKNLLELHNYLSKGEPLK